MGKVPCSNQGARTCSTMTKYILLGGYAHKAPDSGKAFYKELVGGFDEPVKVLMCYFARAKGTWNEAFVEDAAVATAHVAPKKVEFRIADTDTFLEQVKWADVVYLKGGETLDLEPLLKKNAGWEKLLEGKTLAGTSAGAEIISRYSYNIDHFKMFEGYGLVPVKILVHFKSDYNAPNIDWDKIYNETKAFHPELELLTLREGEFKVFNQ